MSNDSIPWLRDRTILLTLAGSRAYGTFTDTSDVDIQGVAVPPPEYFTGFVHRFEQTTGPSHAASYVDAMPTSLLPAIHASKLEGTIHDVRRFFALAANCTPAALDVLFADESDVLIQTEEGKLLRESRDFFLSRAVRHRFSGFAMSQIHRFRAHPENGKLAMHAVRLLRMCREILTDGRVLVKRLDADELRSIRGGTWSCSRLTAWAEAEEAALDTLMQTSPLPAHPNRERLDALCMEIVQRVERRCGAQ